MLKRNVAANVMGGSWTALLALVAIPVQVHFLGVEAYGLIAFLASLQVLASILDLGLSPTITREVTRDRSDGLSQSRTLIRALSVLYWPLGIVLGAALFLSAGWIAASWLHLGTLALGKATLAIRLGAVAIALRWPVSFYAAVVAGRQRFDALNALKAAVATLTLLGGIVVIAITHDLVAFTAWTVIAAAVEVAGYLLLTRRLIPGLPVLPRPAPAMWTVWRFAAGINAINLLAMVLTQSDRLLISRILPIETLGYYALAYNIVYGLSLIPSFVTSAMFPALVASHAGALRDAFRDRYQQATQLLLYVFNAPIWLLVMFGRDLLALITSPKIAEATFLVLWILALGFLLNVAVVLALTACIATGNTWLPIRVNLVAAAVYVPTLILLTLRFGAVGAAVTWLLLNVYYLAVLLPAVHRSVIQIPTVRWLMSTFLPFALAGLASFGGARLILLAVGIADPRTDMLVAVIALAVYAIAGFAFLRRSVRAEIVHSANELRLAFASLSGRR